MSGLLSAQELGSVLAEGGDEIEKVRLPGEAGRLHPLPRVNQSGDKDRSGPLTKHGPTYPRWALLEATMYAYQPSPEHLGAALQPALH